MCRAELKNKPHLACLALIQNIKMQVYADMIASVQQGRIVLQPEAVMQAEIISDGPLESALQMASVLNFLGCPWQSMCGFVTVLF